MAVANIKIRESLFEGNHSIPQLENPRFVADGSLKKEIERNDELSGAETSSLKKRPTNLEDLILGEENFTSDTTEANFSLGDISDSDEIWVFDVPKTIDPKNLKGQVLKLGKKSNFRIGNKLYETSSVESKDDQHLSFVFNTGQRKRPYKTVNLKPAGSVRIRQKLSNISNPNLISPEKVCVPFPKNLKLRHPLFGHDYDEKLGTFDK